MFGLNRGRRAAILGVVGGVAALSAGFLVFSAHRPVVASAASSDQPSTPVPAATPKPSSSTSTQATSSVASCTSSEVEIVNQPRLGNESMAGSILVYPILNTSSQPCALGGGLPSIVRMFRAPTAAQVATLDPALPQPFNTFSTMNPTQPSINSTLPEPVITLGPGHEAGLWQVEGGRFQPNVPFVPKGSPDYSKWVAKESATPNSCVILYSVPTPTGPIDIPLSYACAGVARPEQSNIYEMYPITPAVSFTPTMMQELSLHGSGGALPPV